MQQEAAQTMYESSEVTPPNAGESDSSPLVSSAETPEKEGPPKSSQTATEPDGESSPSAVPQVPKRGKSAYMLFCDSERAAASEVVRARREDAKLVVTELGKELGQRWAHIDSTVKAKYEELAAQQKAQYEAAVQEYVELTGERPKSRKSQAKGTSIQREGGYILEQTTPKRSKPDIATEEGTPGEDAEVVTPQRKAPRTVRRRRLTTMDIDPKVLAEAQRLCLEGRFMEFANSSEVMDRGILARRAVNARMLLKDLQRSKGSVEKARRRMSEDFKEDVVVIA